MGLLRRCIGCEVSMNELSKEDFLDMFGKILVKFNSYQNKHFTFNSQEDDELHIAVSVDTSSIDYIFVADTHRVKDLDIFSGMATVGDEIYHFYEVIYP